VTRIRVEPNRVIEEDDDLKHLAFSNSVICSSVDVQYQYNAAKVQMG
jgi:hypothetical protein